MAIPRPIKTPLSDALVPPALKAIERALETLERAPKRRRRSVEANQKNLKALGRLTKSFMWLMQRYEAIQNLPPDPHRSYDVPRAELKRRLDVLLAEEDAKEAAAKSE